MFSLQGNLAQRLALRVPTLGGSAGFTGALDGASNVSHAYGLRRLLSSYTGDLIRLRRDSDDAESDFGYDSNGDLDTAAISTWLGGASGYVTTWYDQVGSDNGVQVADVEQPLYVASGQNGHPVLRFDGANDDINVLSFTAISPPFAYYAVAKLDAVAVNDDVTRFLMADSSSAGELAKVGFATPDSWRVRSSVGFQTGAPDSNWNVHVALFDGASSQFWINGTSKGTGNTGTGDIDAMNIGSRGASNNPWDGDIAEVVVVDNAATDRATIQSAQGDYWGITIS